MRINERVKRLRADWKEIHKKSRAEAIRARINALEVKRRAIQAEQLRLTNEAEILEGTCDCEICGGRGRCSCKPGEGKPVLTGAPLILQDHPSKHPHSPT